MPTIADPVAGRWYHNRADDIRFMVIAVDRDDEAVEIQHEDGEIEALPLAEWYEAPIEASEAPEDYRPPMDLEGTDELDYSELEVNSPQSPSEGERYRREVVERAGKHRPRE